MTRITTEEFEGSLPGQFTSTTGTIAISTIQKFAGAQSARCNPAAATGYATETVFGGGGGEFAAYFRVYLFIATAPSVSCDFIACGDGTFFGPTLRVETNRTLRMYNSGVAIGVASSAIPLNEWHCVEFYYDDRNAGGDLGNNTSAMRLDGSVVSTAATTDMAGWDQVRIGVVTSTTADFYLDSVAINDQNGAIDKSWPGPVSTGNPYVHRRIPQLAARNLTPTPMVLAANVSLNWGPFGSAPQNYQQPLSATIGFSSAEMILTATTETAALSFTSSQARAIRTNLAGALSFTGATAKRTAKSLTGALSFTGSITKRTARAISASVAFSGSLGTAAVHLFTQALNATLSFTSSQSRSIRTNLAGALSFTGAQSRRVGKSMAATVGFTSSQSRAIRTGLAGALSFTGSITKRTAKNLGVAGLSFAGSVNTAAVHFFTQALNASLSFTSSQSRSVGTRLAGALSFTGTLPRRTAKGVSGGLSFTGSQARSIRTGLAGALSFTSSQARRTAKNLGAASLSFTGSFGTAAVHFFTQALNASLSFTGTLTTRRIIIKALSATLSFTSSQTRRTAKSLVAGLSFTGTQTKRIATRFSAAIGFTSLLDRLSSAIPTSGTASAAQMSVPEANPGAATSPASAAGTATTPTSVAGNATGPTSSAP